ncbi:hypothetical protein ASG52_03225 [Methylobacterium sp. Leaf456]|uniref:sigma-70 family RNA polymerase sigma factor n=1 Tax=Methylobacterium sp. Leaf456 TaxID=1736382 RepID=UPI0007004288|nr:sigma-70 family RNA polymerase sigma factor [Methylobacterium sp. Leaf456]KQT57094.1 hypothetical protein ASG52_03225 [Methylobacterium sp. Leaf456]
MPSFQTSDEADDRARLVDRLRDGYPATVAPALDTRLGRMLARLTAALDAAAVERPVRATIRADLIDLVPRLRRYAASLSCDRIEADDLVQTTLLKAWEKREHLPGGPALAAWLFAVLRRTYLHERRRGAAEPTPESGDADAGEGGSPERSAVRDAVDRLSHAQRETLLLVTVEGLSLEAAAAIVDCAVETVRDRLDQAHDRLARDLGPV